MTLTRLHVYAGVLALCVPGLPLRASAADGAVPQLTIQAESPNIRTGGTRLQVPPSGRDAWSPGQISIPYPHSLDPHHVIANIEAIIQQTKLLETSKISELSSIRKLRAKRILNVKSDLISPGYVVVELEDERGASIANFAFMGAGEPVAIEDLRSRNEPGSMKLTDAATRVRARGRVPASTGYVYFHNVAEPGLSLCRPLAKVETTEGPVYLNSRGEAFVEEDSAIANQIFGTAKRPPAPRVGSRTLLPIGQW